MSPTTSFRLLVLAGAALLATAALGQDAPIELGKGRGGQNKDVMISSEGLREGSLAGCVAESCTIDSASMARSRIVWIGLEADLSSLPNPEDPTRDEVHYRDGSVHPGKLVGIDADEVVTERGRHPRTSVAWVFLTPVTDTAENAPGQYGAPSDGTAAPGDTGGSRPDVPSPPGTAPPGETPPASAAQGGQQSALWAGRVDFEWVATSEDGTIRLTGAYDPVRLREYVSPLLIPQTGRLVRAGTVVTFISEGTVTTQELMVTGVCSYGGRGSANLNGIETSAGSAIWQKSVDIDTTPGIGWNVPPGPGVYQLSLAASSGETYPISGCGNTSEESFLPANIGRYPIESMAHLAIDPEKRFLDGDGRMSGSYAAPLSGGTLTTSWNICREGVECASPAASAPAAEAPNCPRPTNQNALLDLALDQQQQLLDRLAAQMDAYQRLAHQASQWKSDFELAARDCNLWSAARTLMAFLIGTYGPTYRTAPTGMHPEGFLYEPAKQFSNLLYWIEKVEKGDQSWIIPNTEYQGWLSAEDAWDAFRIGYNSLGPSSPERLLAGIQSCGAPTASVNYEGAVKYLRLMQQIEPMMQGVRRTLNDLRQKDLELLDKWNDYHEACQEHAECEGDDPGHCEAVYQ